MDGKGDPAAEEEKTVKADAAGHHHGGRGQGGAEEEGKGLQGAPFRHPHRSGEGERADCHGDQGLGAQELEEAVRAQAEAQVDHVGYGIEGGELEKGDQQQGGKKIQVGPDCTPPPPDRRPSAAPASPASGPHA